MNSDSKKSLTIDYAFIIAILTGLLYLLSFLFYAGTFTFYQIPWFFIEVNISNIISSMIKLSPFVIIIVWVTVYTYQEPKRINKETKPVDNEVLSRKQKKKRRSKFIDKLLSIVIILGLALTTYLIKKILIFYFFTGIILGICVFVALRLYKEKNFIYLTILIYVVTLWLSFGYGYALASEKTTYLIVEENNKTFVSLTVYNEQFVLSPLNMETKEFSNQFQLMEMKEVKNFRQLNIGEIKSKK